MSLENIGIKTGMDGHEFRWKMWKWETPSFPLYYQFDQNRRNQKKKQIEKLYTKKKGELL